MNNKKLIAIDFDDTICNTTKFMLKVANNTFNGIKKSYNELTHEKYLTVDFGLKLEDTLPILDKILLNENFVKNCDPIKWSQEKIFKWKELWHKLVILTWRPEDIQYYRTKRRIDKYFPKIFDKIIFSANIEKNYSRKKSEICKRDWIEILIDDMTKNVENLKDVWTKWFLINTPRNKNYQTDNIWIKKINKWNEIEI